ncbi:MAG TPA: outer membrane beta-barrel protein [Ramlibacter sp.]|nr:outer membrane beta-barrel protein [Ramlibacter sp.]
MGIVGKSLFAVVATVAFQSNGVLAQDVAPHGFAVAGTHNYLGLNLGRGIETNCPAAMIICDSRDRSAQLFAGTMFDKNWGAEVGYVDSGRVLRPMGDARTQGLSFTVVGRTQLLPSVGVFGKLGTAFGRSDTSVMGNSGTSGPEQGFGLAYGGGLSWDFSPRLSAKFEWDSYDLRMGNGPVRSTSLGLQFKY